MSLNASGIIKVITEPELKDVNGTAVASFYGGIQEGKNKQGEYINNAINCTIWGKQAETVMEYVGKGGSFMASGNVLQNEWDDRKTGEKRRNHVFKIQRVELLPLAKANVPAQASEEIPF